jgi:hypothetical protein
VHKRQQEPQKAEASRQVTEGLCPTIVSALGVDHVHLVHQPGMRKIGPAAGNFWVVQRQKGETAVPVPSSQALDLAGTESTLSVVDDHVRVGALAWRGQMGRGCCRRSHTPIVQATAGVWADVESTRQVLGAFRGSLALEGDAKARAVCRFEFTLQCA